VNVDDALRRLPTRGRTFGLLASVVSGLLLLGLLIPFTVGKDAPTAGSSGIDIAAGPLGGGDLGGAPVVDEGPTTTLGGPAATTPGGVTGGGAARATATTAGPRGPSAGTGRVGSGVAQDGTKLTASDVGVTPQAVKVAVFVADLGNVAKLGFNINGGDQVASFDGFAKEVNENGGLNGRKLEMTYIKFDPLDQADMRRACIEATEGQKAFATVNLAGFYGAAILCATEEHKTPYITATQHEPEQWYQRSNGLFISYLTSKSRVLRQMVTDLDSLGLLKGRTVGVVDSAYTADKLAADTALFPALAAKGVKVAHRSTIPEAADEAAAAISVEIEQMRAAGVDTILFAVNFLVEQVWVQQAANRQYNPRYHLSDDGGGSTDGGTSNMPDSFDGTVGFTTLRTGEDRAGVPEDRAAAACRQRYAKATGQPFEKDNANYVTVVGACIVMTDLVKAIRAVGPDLKRAAIPRQYESLGTFEIPLAPPGSFAKGKYDAADYVRTIQWKASCKCWNIVSPYRKFAA
jgi:ABC-type branched-subunit amino acid transport system substrate-binding protein